MKLIFHHFPEDPYQYCDDVSSQMDSIILRHGPEEWRSVVLTNEFHGHLGLYAIIGAKMGLRALEYFPAEHDQLEVLSYAGSAPPISCINDGLQVSTGATLGHGLIRIAPEGPFEPKVTFVYKGRSVTLRLRDTFWQTIRDTVKEAIRIHGNLTDDYWQFIRESSIRYWTEWDRYELFEITGEK